MLHIRSFLRHVRAMVTCWRRVLVLIWRTGPQVVMPLLVVTLITGLVPALQIQLTTHIVQSASDAILKGRTAPLIWSAVLFGIAQGGMAIIAVGLGNYQQYLQMLLQLRLANDISIKIMEKSATLDIQHFENDELYDMLQRANREGIYRPYQLFTQMMSLCSQGVTLLSVVVVLFSWSWWLSLLIVLSPLPSASAQFFYGQKGYLIELSLIHI